MALAGDHVQILVGGYELTGDSNRISIEDKRDLYDVTAFSDAVHNFVPGKRTITMEHAGYLNSAVARSHPVLRANTLQGVVSVLLGANTAPVIGNPTYSLDTVQTQYSTLPEMAKFVPFNAKFANRGERGGWGVALAVPSTITNSTTGSGVDNGAASSKGGAAVLHILQIPTPDTYTIIVEGATNSGFSTGLVTLATFTLNGSALGSERISISGSLPQFTRFKATRTGSAGNGLRLAVNLIRF